MILTTLTQCKRVESLHSHFAQLFEYLRTHDLLQMPLGRIELDSDNLFINNVELQGAPAAEQALEVHEQYIDIHFLLEGEELIGWKSAEHLTTFSQLYDAENDIAFADGVPSNYIKLEVGDMLILYPEDAHAPAIGDGLIRKAIIKIKV